MTDSQFTRHTKIVATLGPASAKKDVLIDMVKAGMNMARLNFSHGDHQTHKQIIDLVREVMQELQCTIGIIADLQGPKIRIAGFKEKNITLQKGDAFILDADLDETAGDHTRVGIHYKELVNDVKTDDFLLVDDGRLKLKVASVQGNQIHTIVQNDGSVSDNKGINLLGGGLSAPALTDKDKEDLQFALQQQVDYVALSFVQNKQDILEAKQIIEAQKSDAGVIAKIERCEALNVLDEIIEASDGVMVARGDLAVEIGDERVPGVQKHLINLAQEKHKPVITATQMMESMITQVVPTRAEMSDVANAVLDGTDAVMLSEETAMGQHPALVIETMARACLGARAYIADIKPNQNNSDVFFDRIDEAIAMSTIFAANHMDVKGIAALTESGATPLWMSRKQTKAPIWGLSRHQRTLAKMTLYRGVFPICFDITSFEKSNTNRKAVACLQSLQVVEEGDRIILTKGDARGVGGGANAMKILIVGKVE